MILSDLKGYLAARGRASLADLEARFGVDADALRGMLAVWQAKGRVRRCDDDACGGCCGCRREAPEIYEWIGPR